MKEVLSTVLPRHEAEAFFVNQPLNRPVNCSHVSSKVLPDKSYLNIIRHCP
jgi:hypothetical protein